VANRFMLGFMSYNVSYGYYIDNNNSFRVQNNRSLCNFHKITIVLKCTCYDNMDTIV